MKIEDFVARITFTRKRTGIMLLDESNSEVLSQMTSLGLFVYDLATQAGGQVIISDDALLNLMHEASLGKPTVFLNLEMHLAPRFQESTYLKNLLPKLIHSEPIQPIFLLFYSKPLYLKFKSYYENNAGTFDHWFESEL